MTSQPACFRHVDRLAVEQCEVCRRPVCGACLWYAESGERLCPDHAAEWLQAGKTVTPPERYADGILPSQQSAAQPPQREIPYKGNSVDVMALAALMAGLAALLSCAGLTWALPIMALALGLVAWLQSRDALDPRRARWMGLIGVTGGGVFVLFFIGLVACFCSVFLFAALLPSGSGSNFPTPLPFLTPTPTPVP